MLISMPSCSDWLEVEMEDQIMEPVLFGNYTGYVAALNGVYTSLNDYYTKSHLSDVLDVMAQYYDVTENTTHVFRNYMAFGYGDAGFESSNSNWWNTAYTILANDNGILDHLKSIDDTPLTRDQYNILRGECLAMRAMLHFDLVRRHGSIYTANPDAAAIPYQNDTKREIQPILSHREVMNLVIADLREAASLLKDSDPIITEGVKDMVTEDNGVSRYDLSFRQLRLNYYAVQGLLARAYLWTGDKTSAYNIAKNEIIDKITTADLQVFPWIEKAEVEADKRPNLIFSTELMFALYNSKRVDYYNQTYSQSLNLSNRLTFYGETMADSKLAYVFDNDNDYRRLQWALVEPSQSEIDKATEEGRDPKSTLYSKKYADFETQFVANGPTTYRYMVPMLRLSEIYYIAAECAPNAEEAYSFLNEVRYHRLCPDLDSNGNLENDLMYEYLREFIGEGQLFFYYKRHQNTMLVSRTGGLDYNMSLGNYVWPLPESEINKRTQVNGK